MAQANLPLVLSVDDERHNLTLMERILRNECRVISVANGQAALDTLKQAPFDLILLDIMMPQMDGLTTLDYIRSNPATADIPVILISALADGQDVARGLEAGANDYITKPIDMDIAKARVQTQIALKKFGDERKRTINELKSVQEMKDRLLRMASHDLKGPLNNVRMAATLMEMFIECVPDGPSLLESISSSLDTMENVIKDFLDTAALQTGVLDLQFEAVALEPFVEDIIGEHKVNALRKNIDLTTYDLSGTIHADPARFHQAFGNLISNAIKYSPKNTTVSIWTECNESDVAIFVADQGPGIPASEHDKLFTQFGKLSPRPTGGESSTGLGLWIVKHLVTLQNGQVGYEAPAEGGSIFWIQMPAAH
jgi:two-component system, sensor histidine kinase and response regulator